MFDIKIRTYFFLECNPNLLKPPTSEMRLGRRVYRGHLWECLEKWNLQGRIWTFFVICMFFVQFRRGFFQKNVNISMGYVFIASHGLCNKIGG